MLIATLLGLAGLTQQTDQLPSPFGKITIGRQSIPIVFPLNKGPYADAKNFVQAGPYRFVIDSAGNLGERYLQEGGWEDLAAAYLSLKDKADKAPVYKVKVLFHTNSIFFERGWDRAVRSRRSSIERYHIQDAYVAMGQFKAMAEVASLGKLQIQFSVSIDDAPQFSFLEAGKVPAHDPGPGSVSTLFFGSSPGELYGSTYIRQALGPRLNNDAGSPDDRLTGGPYDSVIDLHAGLTPGLTTAWVGNTPVTTVPYWFFSDQLASESLPNQLFAIWQSHLAMKAVKAEWRSVLNVLPASGTALPRLPQALNFQLSPSEVDLALRAPTPRPDREPPIDALKQKLDISSPANAFVASSEFGSYLLVRRAAWGLDALKTMKFNGITAGKFGAWDTLRVYKLVSTPPNAASALGFTNITFPTVVPEGQMVSSTSLKLAPQKEADWTPKAVVGTDNVPAWEIIRLGVFTRGSISLARAPHSAPLFPDGTKSVHFKVKSKSEESYALNFLDEAGQTKQSIVFAGTAPIPAEVDPKMAPPTKFVGMTLDGEWHEIAFNLSEIPELSTIHEIRLGPPPFGKYFPRADSRLQTISLTDLSLESTPAAALSAVPMSEGAAFRTELGPITGVPTANQAALIRTAMASQSFVLKANAAALFESVVDPTFIPDLAKLATGATGDAAFFALRSLRHQETPEAQAAIRRTLEVGLFDANRRFAIDVLPAQIDPSYLSGINMLQVSLSWPSREACARALANIQGKEASIFILGLLDDQDPSVRLTVVNRLDPNNELHQRRLLYTAVNDPSEWVRASALCRLVDSTNPKLRAEGYKGVRDESSTVKAMLVRYLALSGNEESRGALRLAILDKNEDVRVATLDAFAGLPQGVQAEEIQNVFDDTRLPVLRAILHLARRTKMALPGNTVKAMRESGDEELMGQTPGGQ